jgi:glycosyltransferase involved in cell wall biosynthesis
VYGFTAEPDIYLIEKSKQNNIEFCYVKNLVRQINPIKDIIAFIHLLLIILEQKPDIVHTHTSKAGILGRWAGWLYNLFRKNKAEIIHSTHGHVFYGYHNRFVSSLFVLAEQITSIVTDKLVVLTENEINDHKKFCIDMKNKFVVIHSGVEASPVTPDKIKLIKTELRIAEDDFVVGSVGRLDLIKGYKYFIDAVYDVTKQLSAAKVKFLIVGDGTEKKSLELRVEKLGIKNKFMFAGWRNDVEQLISVMDVYVQPSLNEGMGKTLVLAQNAGVPVIATNVQGIPSVVKDNETGILVPAKQPKLMAEKIIKLLGDKELRVRLGSAGKKWVTSVVDESGYPQFSVERMNYLHEKLYNNL